MKILIIGCSCIGKSTVAKMVSSDLGIRAVSIDEVSISMEGVLIKSARR